MKATMILISTALEEIEAFSMPSRLSFLLCVNKLDLEAGVFLVLILNKAAGLLLSSVTRVCSL